MSGRRRLVAVPSDATTLRRTSAPHAGLWSHGSQDLALEGEGPRLDLAPKVEGPLLDPRLDWTL